MTNIEQRLDDFIQEFKGIVATMGRVPLPNPLHQHASRTIPPSQLVEPPVLHHNEVPQKRHDRPHFHLCNETNSSCDSSSEEEINNWAQV